MTELRGIYPDASIGKLCGLFGKSRQSYYKWNPQEFRHAALESVILEEVVRIRADAPGMGAYKLYLILQDVFGRENMMGRDAFFDLLRSNGLTIKKRKSRRTTNSYHHFHKWPNRIKGYTPEAPNHLWVSDITYIQMEHGICYLHLVTDAFSRKIVGSCVSTTLQASNSLSALDKAIEQAVKMGADLTRLTHHSDRGIQYCNHLYVTRLNSVGAFISMSEDSNPTDNAIAERVNGILKQEYLLGRTPCDTAEAYRILSRSIAHYNDVRPHMSLGFKVPSLVHATPELIGEKMWKASGHANRNGMTRGVE